MKRKVTILMLDDTKVEFSFSRRATGLSLLDKVCDYLQLEEKDYFGLSFASSSSSSSPTGTRSKEDFVEARQWLNNRKLASQQILKRFKKLRKRRYLIFRVKFYPQNAEQLKEDITRYQICLQLRRDIKNGSLPCSFPVQSQLGAYLVQSEYGDFDSQANVEKFLNQIGPISAELSSTPELNLKIIEVHKTLHGMTPAEADSCYLEIASRLALYGVDFHAATSAYNDKIYIGVCAPGLHIYRHGLRINRFVWQKILKLTYKRNKFSIKLKPSDKGDLENTIVTKLKDTKSAKRLWTACIEHHHFFRLRQASDKAKSFWSLSLPRLRSSTFRFSGRTQFETRQASVDIKREPPKFTRTLSACLASPSINQISSHSKKTFKDAIKKKGKDKKIKKKEIDNKKQPERVAAKNLIQKDAIETTNGPLNQSNVSVYDNVDIPVNQKTKKRSTNYGSEESLSSISQESILGEYATESMRRKTSALIASSTGEIPPMFGAMSRGSPLGQMPRKTTISPDTTLRAQSVSPSFLSKTTSNTQQYPIRAIVPEIEESSKVDSKIVTTKTKSKGTEHEDLSKPEDGVIHKKKVDKTVEQEKTTKKQIKTQNMIITGKLEDITPIIEKQMAEFGMGGKGGPATSVSSPGEEEEEQEYESVSNKSKKIETVTYKKEKDGLVETRVEHKITLESNADPDEHDRALAEAIQEATMMDPNMTVQRIEITQEKTIN